MDFGQVLALIAGLLFAVLGVLYVAAWMSRRSEDTSSVLALIHGGTYVVVGALGFVAVFASSRDVPLFAVMGALLVIDEVFRRVLVRTKLKPPYTRA